MSDNVELIVTAIGSGNSSPGGRALQRVMKLDVIDDEEIIFDVDDDGVCTKPLTAQRRHTPKNSNSFIW